MLTKDNFIDISIGHVEATHRVVEQLQKMELPLYCREEILMLCERLKLCSARFNHWYAKGIRSESGERFNASGRYWRCGSKLCSSCLKDQSRKTRKKLRDAISRYKLRRGERWMFLTFTIPNPSQSLILTRSIVNRAWELFRKRQMCVDLFRGGAKSEEFTITVRGFHYHLHALMITKWFLFTECRRVWSECVRQSFEEHEQDYHGQADGDTWIKIRSVRNVDLGVKEVCKYITKSSSWSKISPNALLEIALVRRWSRMFELVGVLRDQDQLDQDAAEEMNMAQEMPIVHTRALSDGETSPAQPTYWRDRVRVNGFEHEMARLHLEYDQKYRARQRALEKRWPEADLELLFLTEDLIARA